MSLYVHGHGRSWAVYDETSRISGYFVGQDLAANCKDNKERKNRGTYRPCITCSADFKSEGAHHRMCNSCRQHSSGMM